MVLSREWGKRTWEVGRFWLSRAVLMGPPGEFLSHGVVFSWHGGGRSGETLSKADGRAGPVMCDPRPICTV